MSETLLDRYDALLLDLDGTVYRGGAAIDGVVAAVGGARERGTAVRFVTNNASRTPDVVAGTLCRIGVSADPAEVDTSAHAAARLLAERLPSGARVLVVGADALSAEVAGAGLVPVRDAHEAVEAVVQGFSEDTGWRELADACVAITAGALWVACNTDRTLPTERGDLPGTGSLVAALSVATGARPVVAGKPARPLLDEAVLAAGATRPLVVGDRLETDIAGAGNAGLDALLVLTGVTTPAGLLRAGEGERPRYVARDTAAVLRPTDELTVRPQRGWEVAVRAGGVLRVEGSGGETDEMALLRALCATWWRYGEGEPAPCAVNAEARDALDRLGMRAGAARTPA